MFKNETTLGVIIAIFFIIACLASVLYFTRKLIAQEKILFLLIFLVTLLASVWTIDNVVAFRIELLTDKENETILKSIENIISLVLGFYFGSKQQKEV